MMTELLLKPLVMHAPPLTVDARDLRRRNEVFLDVAPREPDKSRVGEEEPNADQPPDLPDQRETGDRGEECGYESGRAVPRHLDRFVFRLSLRLLGFDGMALHFPLGPFAADL